MYLNFGIMPKTFRIKLNIGILNWRIQWNNAVISSFTAYWKSNMSKENIV